MDNGLGSFQDLEALRLCENNQNTEWYVVEEGGQDGLGFDVCKRSLVALQGMGK